MAHAACHASDGAIMQAMNTIENGMHYCAVITGICTRAFAVIPAKARMQGIYIHVRPHTTGIVGNPSTIDAPFLYTSSGVFKGKTHP